MTMMRALFLASLLGGLALVACGSAGSGGATPTVNPALGTNKPASSPMPSGDPYSDYGY
jgi:ABC-type glycerol-3-phosphate transport system substrate-binding protein